MKKMAAVTLATMLLLPPAAMADAAGDYAALVTAAKEGDPGTDYTAMRQAYLMLPEYDPSGEKTEQLMRDGQAAYTAKDCKTALVKFQAATALTFILSDAHALIADCLEQAGDKDGEKREEAIAQGLFNSVMSSGDGAKPETAFRIITLSEENAILSVAGVNGTKREMISTDAGPVEKISITDAATGQQGAVYFNVGAIVMGMALKEKNSGKPPAKQ
jgi:hypothetical protein